MAVIIAIAAAHALSATDMWPSGRLGATLAFGVVVAAVAGLVLAAARWAALPEPVCFDLVQRLAHALIPAAVAWMLASFGTVILFDGQLLVSTASDPFALGWDLFGTAGRKVDCFLRRPEPVWYAQCAVLLAGHGLSLVMVHDQVLAEQLPADRRRVRYATFGLLALLTALGVMILAG